MSQEFLERLERARLRAEIPFVITSGYRCESHNLKVGGKPASSHLMGKAADISAGGSRERFIIFESLLKVGFTRVGVAKTFIHVDNDPLKDPMVFWLY